jgi:hypothetical protein
MVCLNPKFAPEFINIKLFGPGVMEDTNAKIVKADNISKFIINWLFVYCYAILNES